MTKDTDKPAGTEALILRAAEREFLEKGYAGAKTTSIAEAAGVTHAMLHYYFRTKDKLFEQIAADKIGQLGELLLGALGDPGLPLAERLRRGIESHFDFLAANPALPRFVVNELAARPERIEPLRDALMRRAGDTLGALQAEIGRCAAKPVDALMLLVDIVSLNLFPFLAAPMVQKLAGSLYGDYATFLEARKRENVHTVLHKLGLS